MSFCRLCHCSGRVILESCVNRKLPVQEQEPLCILGLVGNWVLGQVTHTSEKCHFLAVLSSSYKIVNKDSAAGEEYKTSSKAVYTCMRPSDGERRWLSQVLVCVSLHRDETAMEEDLLSYFCSRNSEADLNNGPVREGESLEPI